MPRFDEKGDLVGVIHVVRDITERKKAESMLKESEERFRTIVKNSEAIIFMLDNNGVFLLSEGKALSSLELNPGQVVGKSALEMYKDYPDVIRGMIFSGLSVWLLTSPNGSVLQIRLMNLKRGSPQFWTAWMQLSMWLI
jgi:PAS domain-containing protein